MILHTRSEQFSVVQLEGEPEGEARQELEARLNLACTEHQSVDHVYFVANPLYYKRREHWLLEGDTSAKDRDAAMARAVVPPPPNLLLQNMPLVIPCFWSNQIGMLTQAWGGGGGFDVSLAESSALRTLHNSSDRMCCFISWNASLDCLLASPKERSYPKSHAITRI